MLGDTNEIDRACLLTSQNLLNTPASATDKAR